MVETVQTKSATLAQAPLFEEQHLGDGYSFLEFYYVVTITTGRLHRSHIFCWRFLVAKRAFSDGIHNP